jgi:hypothetical protein
MQNTMTLLAKALDVKPIAEWTRELGLSQKALYTARDRGHLSPAIAGDLADRIGESMEKWVVIAAAESERDSASKDRLLKKIRNW